MCIRGYLVMGATRTHDGWSAEQGRDGGDDGEKVNGIAAQCIYGRSENSRCRHACAARAARRINEGARTTPSSLLLIPFPPSLLSSSAREICCRKCRYVDDGETRIDGGCESSPPVVTPPHRVNVRLGVFLFGMRYGRSLRETHFCEWSFSRRR